MAHITEKWWTLQEKSFFYHSAIVVKQSSNGSDSGPEQKNKVTLMDILQWQNISSKPYSFQELLSNSCKILIGVHKVEKDKKADLKSELCFFPVASSRPSITQGTVWKMASENIRKWREKVSSLSNTTLLPYFCSPVWPVPQLTEHLKETIFPDDDFVASYQ